MSTATGSQTVTVEDSGGQRDAGGTPGAGGGLPPRAFAGLVELSQVLAEPHGADELLVACARAARATLGAASVSLSRWDRESGVIRTLVNEGDLAAWEEPLPTDEVYPLSEWTHLAARYEEHQGWLSLEGDPALAPAEAEHLRRLGRPWALQTPVVLQGRAWGELYATRHREQDPWDEDDLRVAGLVTTLIGAGLLRAGELERVNRLAYSDPLTGLANRRGLDEFADAAVERYRSDGIGVGAVLCDVNRLKEVNDRSGHQVGDQLIVAFSEMLSAAAGDFPRALAARLGGDEFCLLIDGAPPDQVVAAADRLAETARSLPGGHGVSVGVACIPDAIGQVDSGRRLLRLADAAQYRAKRSGSRRAVVAGRQLPPATAHGLSAEPDIEPGMPERRRVFSRSTADAGAVLAQATQALDALVDRGPLERLTAVATTLARALDASGWAVSRRDPGGAVSVLAQSPGTARLVLPLSADRPLGAAALAGDGAAVVTGAPSNDPVLDARLVAAGSAGALVAGSREPAGGDAWLLEVVTDEMSARVHGLGPVLRALLCLAVHG